MSDQLPLFADEDTYDPDSGLTAAEWVLCAQWAIKHRRATNWVVDEAKKINRPKSEGGEGRAVSWRIDLDPTLTKKARLYGLQGLYPGVDHNLSALLGRYFKASRGLNFRLRARARDNVKNATPKAGEAAA